MKIEEKLGNKDGPCWANYIRRCIENETLIVPPNLWSDEQDRREKINKLTEQVMKYDTRRKMADFSSEIAVDSITKAYKKVFESQPSLQCYKMQLKSMKEGHLEWEIGTEKKSSQPVHNTVPLEGKLLCNLGILNYNKAFGHPLDSSQPVTLNGQKNWKGALDGDLVAVDVFKTSKDGKKYGSVVKVIKQGHQERYLCRMSRYSIIQFNPVDRKTPCIVNLPRISRELINLRKKDIVDGLNQWVVIFEEDSLLSSERDELPRIKEIITAESARNLMFVVRLIGWEPQHRLPLGAVVESLPLGTNSFNAERLLRAAYSIYKDDHDQESSNEFEEEDSVPLLQAEDELVYQAFTIDPSDARNLDDALSLVRESDGSYTMAVLIPNVSSHLKQGSELDKRAQERATAVYEFFRNMIPDEVCQKLSLNPNTVHDVIIVSTRVTLNDDGSVSIHTDSNNPTIKTGKMQSQIRLDYVEAQHFLSDYNSDFLQRKLGQYVCSPGQPDLSQSLRFLYRIAMFLREQRLGQAAHAYDFSEDENIVESWQAHLLVKELMIWANTTVAKFVYQHHAVLRKQARPDVHELSQLQQQHNGILGHSVSMSTLATSEASEPLVIPYTTSHMIQEAIESKDAFKLQR